MLKCRLENSQHRFLLRFLRKIMHKTLAFTVAIAVSTSALAQSTTDVLAKTPNSAYVQDARGVIVRSSAGLCWRTNYWTPADAVLGCDGDLAPPVVSAIAPPIVQPSANPEPIKMVEPHPVAVRCDFTLTLDSDQTFKFDNATLSAAAKTRIDTQLRDKLASCAHVDDIVVSGYTDRLGPDAYNQALSQRRASAVAEYLKRSGVSTQIEQRGLGKQHELKDCNGVTIRKKLIDCLSPNRRVEIEVHGTAN
jgi:OOP family OmpA-OmpF porin